MTDAELNLMAEDFLGFGSWGGDICFIGPEQGMSKDDSNLQIRFDAWKKMGGLDLLDCKIYHHNIPEYRWHGDGNGSKIKPQSTWRKLIRTALAFRGGLPSSLDVLNYQANKWASSNSKDCVIELSGLPAHNQGVDRPISDDFLNERIDRIKNKLQSSNFKVVLLYGKGRKNSCDVAWLELTRGLPKNQRGIFEICKSSTTTFVKAPHPTASKKGNTNEAWIELGKRLRQN